MDNQVYVYEVNDLTYIESIEMSALKLDFEKMANSTLHIDFKNMTHFEPFSMLVSGHIFKRWVQACKENNIKIEYKNYQHCSYAGHMGYFKQFGLDFGKNPNEANGSSKYLPITIINVENLRNTSLTKREQIQDTIVRKSNHLASILGQGNYNLELTLAYAIREIMRNVVEHSQSSDIYLAAQRWENKGEVEIAIFDEGIGIKASLQNNPNLNISDTHNALQYCLEPGISGRAFYEHGILKNSTNSKWDNSGFGLYVTSELCKMGGEFTIVSYDKALHLESSIQNSHNTHINGTGIRLKLNIKEIPDLGDKIINDIVTTGEEKAKLSNENRVISASKMSKFFKLT